MDVFRDKKEDDLPVVQKNGRGHAGCKIDRRIYRRRGRETKRGGFGVLPHREHPPASRALLWSPIPHYGTFAVGTRRVWRSPKRGTTLEKETGGTRRDRASKKSVNIDNSSQLYFFLSSIQYANILSYRLSTTIIRFHVTNRSCIDNYSGRLFLFLFFNSNHSRETSLVGSMFERTIFLSVGSIHTETLSIGIKYFSRYVSRIFHSWNIFRNDY